MTKTVDEWDVCQAGWVAETKQIFTNKTDHS